MVVETALPSDGLTLQAHLARPSGASEYAAPAVVFTHGFPSAPAGGANSYSGFAGLVERVATTMGWVALSFQFRGTGESEGDFSLDGWLDDIANAVAFVRATERVGGVWLAGFGTGGSLAVCAGADDPDVRGVAAVAAPADFADWARSPRKLLDHARELGVITTEGFPDAFDAWSAQLAAHRAESSAARLQPRPLLVMHGSDDDLVPQLDARAVAEAHGQADLRVIGGAGHRLRHDPRAVAVLLGWLERQRHRAGV
ncbi:MAG: alpha/beta hydrolase [Acidimicrobiia bacterium]|nr:alpha/beta hydrolase [Acidimicrobiia bacterium]